MLYQGQRVGSTAVKFLCDDLRASVRILCLCARCAGIPCITEQGKKRQVEHVDGECCFQRGVQHVRRRGHRPLRPSRRRRPCARTRNPPRHHFAQGEDCHGCSWRTVGFYIPVSQYKSVYPTPELQSVVFLSCGIFMSHFCFVYQTLMTYVETVAKGRGRGPLIQAHGDEDHGGLRAHRANQQVRKGDS